MHKILLTGASGFLGKCMLEQWKEVHEVITLSRDNNANIICDLSSSIPTLPNINMVVHAAGRAHTVPKTDADRKAFFSVNVTGTKNLLAALEGNDLLQKFIFISSVSVYGLTLGTAINEREKQAATDAYGKSKIAAEKLVIDWCTTRNIDYYIFRLPLIAGKNALGNLGAMVSGIQSGRYFSIGKANAKKSIVLAKDVANLISSLNGPSGIYNLTDGYHPSFSELELKITAAFNKGKPRRLPTGIAKLIGLAGDLLGVSVINSNKVKKIISTLTFDDSNAKTKLKWQPNGVLANWEIL